MMLRMRMKLSGFCGVCAAVWALGMMVGTFAQAPKPSQLDIALKYKPKQAGVEYSSPTAEEAPNCKLQSIPGGLRVLDPSGLTLREFVDVTGDKAPDEWRYFQNGILVYAEFDTNADRKPDTFRWYNTAGTRWGVDSDADGVIDAWKVLSVQELSSEAALALASGDAKRFEALLLSADELKDLGLGDAKNNLVKERLLKARQDFAAASAARAVSADAQWVQFSGTRPSTFASGTDGALTDVDYYENASCVVNAAAGDLEIAVGTLVRVGNVWKTVDAPHLVTPETASEMAVNTIFIQVANPGVAGAGTGGAAPNVEELNRLDEKIAQAATATEMATLHAQKADLLEKLAGSATSPEDREMWVHNLADSITGAVQQGLYPGGLARLQALVEKLKADENDRALAAYVQFRLISTDYALSVVKPGVSYMQVRSKWVEDLNTFIKDFPDTPDTAEAMLQLGMETENDGQDDKAHELYAAIVAQFPDTPSAAKARGAATRLKLVGKPLAFTAPVYGQEGKQINVASLKGRVVVLHFWASWMGDAQRDMDKIKEIQAKFPKDLVVVGVNLDDRMENFTSFLTANRIQWFQVFEEGGIDSRPANLLGIFSVPTIIVVGKDGNVLSRTAHISELEKIVVEAVK